MKNKVSQTISARFSVGLLAASSAVLVGGTFLPSASMAVVADSYQNRINALQAENNKSQAAISGLRAKAATYQDAINQLQTRINSIQSAIDKNVAEQASLNKQIAEAQAQIDQQKVILGNDLKTMYVDGTPSTIEELATSQSLSVFVDKQEYRTAVQTKIQQTMQKIAALQAQLQTAKAKVDKLLTEEKSQQATLASAQAEQASLLHANQSQQAAYVSQVNANNAKIVQIQAERAAAIARISGSGGRSAVGSPIQYKNFWTAYSTCGGGYSYCWAGYDQLVSDPWGLGYAHECVHFVADWLQRHGYQVPHFSGAGGGNANMWAGYGTVVSNPRVGDVAYMPLAPVGHVGIVTAVNGDGTYHIEQMNWPVGGYYSEMDLYPTNITFIRFPS